MRYIHAVEGALLALTGFAVLFLLFPPFGQFQGSETVLTVATFLFAILIGFFLTRLNSRYDTIRDLVVSEDANMKILYLTAKAYGPAFTKELAEVIDDYYIIAFDSDLNDYSSRASEATFQKIWSTVTEKNQHRSESSFQCLLVALAEIEKSRTGTAAISIQKLGTGEWATLLVLATIILVSILGLGSDTLALQVMNVLLSSTLVLVLLIIRDLQNLLLGGKTLWAEESGQEVLETMGKLRYYNKYYLDQGINVVPERVKEYRLGTHVPGSGQAKRIKVVREK